MSGRSRPKAAVECRTVTAAERFISKLFLDDVQSNRERSRSVLRVSGHRHGVSSRRRSAYACLRPSLAASEQHQQYGQSAECDRNESPPPASQKSQNNEHAGEEQGRESRNVRRKASRKHPGFERIDDARGLKRNAERRRLPSGYVCCGRGKCTGGIRRQVVRADESHSADEDIVGHHLQVESGRQACLHRQGTELTVCKLQLEVIPDAAKSG